MTQKPNDLTPEQIAERTEAAAVAPGFGVDARSIFEAWGRIMEEAAEQPRAFLSAQAQLGAMLAEIWLRPENAERDDGVVPEPSKDEIGFLVSSFNDMTQRIAQARDEAARSQQQVEQLGRVPDLARRDEVGALHGGVLLVRVGPGRHEHHDRENHESLTLHDSPPVGLVGASIRHHAFGAAISLIFACSCSESRP